MKTPRVTLDQWRALQTVVDTGGYAQAAEKLHRSQSSVSYTVSKLQDQLGIPLLQIEGRKAQLTDAGRVVLDRSRQLVRQASELEAFAHNLGRGWESEIRLVVDAAFPTPLIMNVLQEFQPQNRGSRVQLREVILSGAEEALRDGLADLVIGAWVPQGFLGDHLMETEFVAVAHPNHALHQLGRELTSADLTGHVQVVIRDSGVSKPVDFGWLGAEQRWSVTRIETAVATIANGLGFGWLPHHQIESKLADLTLKTLPLREGGSYGAPLYLIFAQPNNVGPAATKLAELFREHALRCKTRYGVKVKET